MQVFSQNMDVDTVPFTFGSVPGKSEIDQICERLSEICRDESFGPKEYASIDASVAGIYDLTTYVGVRTWMFDNLDNVVPAWNKAKEAYKQNPGNFKYLKRKQPGFSPEDEEELPISAKKTHVDRVVLKVQRLNRKRPADSADTLPNMGKRRQTIRGLPKSE